MGTKQHPGAYDCYATALPDEPLFVLLARDDGAPDLVEAWARDRASAIAEGSRPPGDVHKVIEAFECAAKMRRWRERNNGKWRNPMSSAPAYAVPATTSETNEEGEHCA